MYKRVLMVWVGLSAGCLLADECFVISKKKKSVVDAKEQCCTYITDALRSTPETILKIARVQENAMEMVQKMVTGTFFAQIKKEDLLKEVDEYQAFAERQE